MPTSIDYSLLTNEQKKFIATVAGEALNTSDTEIQACASAIMNRKKHSEWRSKSIDAILNYNAFNAVGGVIFTSAISFMNNGTWVGDTSGQNRKKFNEIVAPLALPIYNDNGRVDYAKEAVFFTTTGKLYFHGEKVDLGNTIHDFYKHVCVQANCYQI